MYEMKMVISLFYCVDFDHLSTVHNEPSSIVVVQC